MVDRNSYAQWISVRFGRFLLPYLLLTMTIMEVCSNANEIPKVEPSSDPFEDQEEKRSPQFYSFGLGKRSEDSEYDANFLEDPSYFETGEKYPPLQETKKDGNFERYSFGLGKRAEPGRFAFGLGKRESRYAFGLGKREPSRFAFGLGKREPSRFAFGLGKREMNDDLEEYIKRRFSFGLGKRAVDPRFAFGLGRRKKSDVIYRI